MNLFKRRIAALCVLGLTLGSSLLGCSSQDSGPGGGSKNTSEQTSPVKATTGNSKIPSTTPASSTAAGDNGSALVPRDNNPPPVTTDNGSASESPEYDPSTEASDSLPAGYTLDQTCDKGTGSTGLDIYYRLPPSDSFRFACVHRVDKSSSINYGDSTFAQNLAEVGGPYCAFSSVDKNIGCALVPITPADLMNVPPPQEEQPPVQSQPPLSNQQQTPAQQPVQNEQPSSTTTDTSGLSNNNYYDNSKGNTVHSPAYSLNGSVPAGATAQCGDGTYSFSQSTRGTCSSHGGVAKSLR